MDLRQLNYFLSLYEEGSTTRAARRMNVVQPALSMQISKLEDEFGQKLFEIVGHRQAASAAGTACASCPAVKAGGQSRAALVGQRHRSPHRWSRFVLWMRRSNPAGDWCVL